MSVAWEVEEHTYAVNVLGRITIAVYAPVTYEQDPNNPERSREVSFRIARREMSAPELEALMIEKLDAQADFWRSRSGSGRLRDGRPAPVRFEVEVRAATANERREADQVVRGRPVYAGANPSHYEWNAFQSLANFMHRSPGRSGLNIALPTQNDRAFHASVIQGCIMRYSAGAITLDNTALPTDPYANPANLTFLGAHEMGHLFGLDERYEPIMVRGRLTGYRPTPNWAGNVMSFGEERQRLHIDPQRGDDGIYRVRISYRDVRMPWLGHTQYSVLAELAVWLTRRSTPNLVAVRPPSDIPGDRGILSSGASHWVHRYFDRRPAPPRSRSGCDR